MLNMNISQRIAERMMALNVKGVDITKHTGVSSGGVSQWKSGITKPTGEKLLLLAEILQCSPEWLVNGKEKQNVASIRDTVVGYSAKNNKYNNISPVLPGKVPIITYKQAGAAMELVDMLHKDFAYESIICPVIHSKNTYALRVEGDSMLSPQGRSYPEGCIIYIDPALTSEISSGDRIIAKTLNSSEITFKTYILDGGTEFLKPLNTSYPSIHESFEILGKVIGSFMPD